jgi:hypothetical protein
VAALAGRHENEDVVRIPMRLAVTGRVDEIGGSYRLVGDT